MTALFGHRDFVKTTCPGNRYQEWVPQLRDLIEEDDMTPEQAVRAVADIMKEIKRKNATHLTPEEKFFWDTFRPLVGMAGRAEGLGGGSATMPEHDHEIDATMTGKVSGRTGKA